MANFHLLLNKTKLNFNFSLSQVLNVLEEHHSRDKVFDFTTETIIVICYAIVMGLGLFCNLLICSVILWNSKIRSTRNIFVVNLNVSDIILCVFCMPFTLLVLIRRSWSLGLILCKAVPYLQASTIFVSASTVLAIALDRYDTILNFNPQHPRGGRRKMLASTAIIWISALVLSIPICVFQSVIPVGLASIQLYSKCAELWPNPNFKSAFTIFILFVQFVVPGAVLLLTHINIRLYLNARIYQKNSFPQHIDEQDLSTATNQSSATNISSANHIDEERLQRELKRNTRATMVLLNISIVFTLSWLPWNTLNLLAEFYPKLMEPKTLYLAFTVCHLIAMSSSITNPILYGWLNSNIRREMVRMGSVIAKAGTALMSNRNSQSENMAAQQNTVIKSSADNSSIHRSSNNNVESQF